MPNNIKFELDISQANKLGNLVRDAHTYYYYLKGAKSPLRLTYTRDDLKKIYESLTKGEVTIDD